MIENSQDKPDQAMEGGGEIRSNAVTRVFPLCVFGLIALACVVYAVSAFSKPLAPSGHLVIITMVIGFLLTALVAVLPELTGKFVLRPIWLAAVFVFTTLATLGGLGVVRVLCVANLSTLVFADWASCVSVLLVFVLAWLNIGWLAFQGPRR